MQNHKKIIIIQIKIRLNHKISGDTWLNHNFSTSFGDGDVMWMDELWVCVYVDMNALFIRIHDMTIVEAPVLS